MKANEYQKMAMRTNDGKTTKRLLECMLTCDMEYLLSQNLVYEDEQHLDLGGIFNACLGLSGEVGEFNDMIKKWVFHEKELDMEHAKKEMGDVLWYVAMMCESFGWNMDEIMQMNVDKLKARYPEGFSVDRSLHRADGDVQMKDAVRDWIGVMNSEKKYRNKKMPGRDQGESATALWWNDRKTGRQESKRRV